MSARDRDLPALVGSRICHDLISPLGAISNGLELIDMATASGTPGAIGTAEMDLIRQSVANASARVSFFRIAFGAAPHGVSIASADIARILEAHFADGRTRVDWLPASEIPRRDAKRAFLAVLCIAQALPRGGCIEVAQDPQSRRFTIAAESEHLRIDEALWSALLDPATEPDKMPVDAAQVNFALLAEMTGNRQQPLEGGWGSGRVWLRF